jgi:anti-anti-sigma factor
MFETDSEVQDGLLSVCHAIEGDRVRFALRGELDLANAKTAERGLLEAMASGHEVLIDLAKLEFIDSTGISILVMALSGDGAEKISFLPSETEAVGRLLNLTGLDARMRFASAAQAGRAMEPEPLPHA